MKFTLLTITSLAAIAAAQSSQTTTQAATSVSVSLTPLETCVIGCGTDVNCQAACAGVPSPNESTANQTTECAAACDQGDGSPEATEKYAACQQACIYSIFLTTGTKATATGAAATGTATGTTLTASHSGASGSGKFVNIRWKTVSY